MSCVHRTGLSRMFLAPVLAAAAGLQCAHAQTARPARAAATTVVAPCDIYAAAGTPCVAAHSTTRALYAGYRGPLYQVKRMVDGKTLDIATAPSLLVADAAAQDRFCAGSLCVMNVIYDQSGKGNHLYQAAPGTFKGTAVGAFDTQPIADMAPTMLDGHKVYGVYMMPGMGLRNNDASYLPVGDEPQGIYSVVDGTHYDSGCCFDYGNASTNGRAVGTGTMDTTYFGTSTVWGRGAGAGPWVMTDMEAGLFSGHSAKQNTNDPTVDHWRFVTEVVDGGGGNHWDLRGGDAQRGSLTTFYSGARPDANASGAYFPMRRQGGLLLGTGGDNGNGSAGTFYEGVMTAGAPSEATTDAVQANIVAAQYGVFPVSLARAKTFTPGSSQDIAVTFRNSEEKPIQGLQVRLVLPSEKWSAVALDPSSGRFAEVATVPAGGSVTANFRVTAPASVGSGFLIAVAEWGGVDRPGRVRESVTQRIRNAAPVKLNEVRFGTASDALDQFVELYNASEDAIDLSGWSLVHTPSQWPTVTLATLPRGTRLAGHGFYLLGVSGSGLVAAAAAGDSTIHVRSTAGFAVGQRIDVDGESRTIAKVDGAATARTTVFIPVSTGPRMTVPAGSTNLPVTSAEGFTVGQRIGVGAGGSYEIRTVTKVGKAATQTTLVAQAASGATHLAVRAGADMLPGDTLIIGAGQRKEQARVASVAGGGDHWEIALAGPLKLDHAAEIDVSDRGTGVSYAPATRFAHSSGDPVQALGGGVRVDQPLQRAHGYGAPVTVPGGGMGYQGKASPDLWTGVPLSATAGSLALMDSRGTVVDALVYGSQQSNSSANGTITSPELATLEGDQAGGGCIVVVPGTLQSPGTSVSRYPDGADTDSNCTDFRAQTGASLQRNAVAGSANVKVSTVSGFHVGQSVLVGNGATQETATITEVGSAGGTTVAADTAAGATVVPVASGFGFSVGQAVTIDSGDAAERSTVVSISRRPSPAITLSAPLARPHHAGTSLAGTGISFSGGLNAAHASGESVVSAAPTPGQPNSR